MSEDIHQLIQSYNQIVEAYQNLHHKISRLLDEYGGTESMPSDILDDYHEFARQRDEVFNEMRQLELDLFSDSSSDN